LHKITFDILVPNSAAYFYISWPLILFSILVLISNKFIWEFSIFNLFLSLSFTFIMISVGALFLHFSVRSVKDDVEREVFKLTGLKPLKS